MKNILMAHFEGLLHQLLELRKSVKPSWVVASLWALRLASGAFKYVAGMVTTMLKRSVQHLLPSQKQQQRTTSAKVLMLCGE
jgi:hypothetical protein